MAKLPYESLTEFQRAVDEEIDRLHRATEKFVRIAARKAAKTGDIRKIERNVLKIGKNIDELETMLRGLKR